MLRSGIRHLPRLAAFPRPTPAFAAQQQKRSIFSEGFIGLTQFKNEQKKANLFVRNHAEFKSRVMDSFQESKNISSEDLEKFVYLTNTPEEAEFLFEVSKTGSFNEGLLPTWLFKICYQSKNVQLAMDYAACQPKDASAKYLIYFMTLYTSGEYGKILEEVSVNKCWQGKSDFFTVAAASSFNMGTRLWPWRFSG